LRPRPTEFGTGTPWFRVKAVIKQRSRNEWLKRLDASGVPCGAIRTVAEVCDGEMLRARGMIAEMPHLGAGNVKGIKSAIHLSEAAGKAAYRGGA
jgi:crotonobetainyl-CoA:carnitine CoA-transferase CaiB-like acyl-CoA transferase